MEGLSHLEYQNTEFDAWQATTRELEALGFSGWDDPKLKRLWAHLMVWGEALSDIRIMQDYEVRKAARDDAERHVKMIGERPFIDGR